METAISDRAIAKKYKKIQQQEICTTINRPRSLQTGTAEAAVAAGAVPVCKAALLGEARSLSLSLSLSAADRVPIPMSGLGKQTAFAYGVFSNSGLEKKIMHM